MDPATRAASLLKGTMIFRDLVASEELEPDMAKNSALCSQQYQFMFNSTRIPEIPSDVTRVSAEQGKNNHVVVLRKNKFYVFDLILKDGRALSMEEIKR